MRTEIRRLESAGVDEDTIVEHLKVTHKEVRRKMIQPTEALTVSCRAEIQHTDDYEATSKQLATMYRTSETEIYKARYNSLPRTTVPSKEEVMMAVHEGYTTVKDIAKHLRSRELPVRKVLEAEGLATPPNKTTVTRGVRPAILARLREGLVYSVIAKEFDCSESTVSEIARANGLGRQTQRQRITGWQEILEYAEEHSVSAASRKFNVERSNIYYHRKKAL